MIRRTVSLVFATLASVSGFGTIGREPTHHSHSVARGTVNPCADAPLRAQLPNVPCNETGVQSPINVTVGAVGLKDAALDPIPDFNAAGMCTVNVHWHLGAEHDSEGEYSDAYDFPHPHLPKEHRRLAEGGIPHSSVGKMCRIAKEGYDRNDPIYTTEYDWQYCKDMHVGLTYEIHWPHSSLGHCQSEWQLQHPFMDGVLCDATVGGVDLATAADLIFTQQAVKIGVEGQVFTIVNSGADSHHSEHAMQTWDALDGWNKEIATDVATYKGSTTGDGADNIMCRGTGGMVTWHVDRDCHALEASTMDNLCRRMLVDPTDDLTADVYPHGSRDTVSPAYADSSASR